MKFMMQGANVKIFGKAMQALAKLGDELYIVADDSALSLRVFSSSMSSYACFAFLEGFFDTFETSGADYKAKLSMKSSLLAFRSVHMFEKTVANCMIELNEDSDILITLKFQKGMTKRFRLPLIEYEELEFLFKADGYTNEISGPAKLLSDVLANFPVCVHEVTLKLSPTRLEVCNHVDAGFDPLKTVNTNVSIDRGEFDQFRVGEGGEATFCLKEYRAVLAFSEGLCLSATLHLDAPGKPLVTSFEGTPGLKSTFVAATLSDQCLTATRQRPTTAAAKRKPTVVVAEAHSESIPAAHSELTSAAKRMKAMLLGLTASSSSMDCYTSQLPVNDEVLAEATDDDEDD